MTDHSSRDRLIWTVLVVLGVVVLAIAGTLGWGVMSDRLESAKKLDSATVLVESADRAVIAIDEVVRAELTAEVGRKARELEPTVAPAKRQLEDAVALVDAAYPHLNDTERRRAKLLRTTANAKTQMLEQAPTILSANAKAAQAQPLAEDAWARTLAADKLADSAVASYNKLTKAGVQASAVNNAKAEQGFKEARDLFSQAATAFPEAGMDRYIAYVDQKLVVVSISRKSDAAWLAGKPAEANALIATYNAADAKGVAMAKALPASPATAIADAYKAMADAATEAYFEARKRASAADQELKAL